jgi:hypothetical protein
MDGFKVHRENGETWQFKKFASGLYYYDAAASKKNNTPLTAYSLFNTVASLEKQYTKKEVSNAKLARRVQIEIGRPSQRKFEIILKNNQLRNCPINVMDAKRSFKIYGPDPSFLKGVTKKSKGIIVPPFHPVVLPKEIYPKHKDV